MSIKILSPGLLTTIQDTGRIGHRKEGIILSGAMDSLALRLANLLVGNPEQAAALEITLTGPKILFQENCLLALTGANLNPKINGCPVKMWRPVMVRAGSILAFGKPVLGSRTYLAVAGSFHIPKILGSYATYLKAGIGGFNGRALQTGDSIPGNWPAPAVAPIWRSLEKKPAPNGFAEVNWRLGSSFYPTLVPNPVIRALKGPEYEWFAPDSQKAFWELPFSLTNQSDRMGYRLKGPALNLLKEKELLSSAVTFGTVQVPAQGQPIVLMADHQTTGGYPRLAQVITADFSLLAQVQPGAKIQYKEINLPEAQGLLLAQEKRMNHLKNILSLKFKT
ncbi:KipI antagonist [Adhaeribacter aerolatus]|uniref:KipI antagonist n=1 Tax=Adhaeribacter aerolatus TaxID=670289 RepID=A0A512B4M5_9BACT|nr:biotin-dependent carboxyltransferase family protein [Adhaeribacter aerolatus]GEO06882.1 KipI antagonist [Adhaeribacter aerolatus]